MDTTDRFISDFSQWIAKQRISATDRRKFVVSLRKAINEKLPNEDQEIEVVTRPLSNSENLVCQFDSPEQWLYRYSNALEKNDQKLVAGIIAPSWRRGWREFEHDEFLEDLLSNFFHFACQYVQRSRIANLTGAIAVTYERACEFRYGGLFISYDTRTTDPIHRRNTHLAKRELHQLKCEFQGAKRREFLAWVRSINCLDPYIHKAIFHFWRATALYQSGYLEEFVTALDSITTVAALYLQERMSVASQTRNALQTNLGVSDADSKNLKTLYELRCDFGAHPSKSKWWDFGEIYEDDLTELRNSSKQLLWLLCKSEQRNRVVESHPAKWSEWFRANALMLYNSVWFKHIR